MIQIITDSTAGLPPVIAEHEGILVVPAQVLFGTEGFRDGVELTSEAFFERLALDTGMLPTTTLPLRSDFEAVYTIARTRGADAALSIHLGSAFSGTCSAAGLAAEEAPLPSAANRTRCRRRLRRS
ncbi:MAG: DegV family protein [Ardenticatenaceae bacterium]|nr:DegV family protein [Ardenticatenaceae bacterium]